MAAWHLWIIAGVILLLLEILTAGFLLACFGIACLGTSIAAYMDYSITVQVFVFVFVTIIVFFSIKPLFEKYFFRPRDHKKIGVQALIGRNGIVTDKIQNSKDTGRIQVGGESWKAVSETGVDIDVDEVVTIRRVESATLFVKRKTEEGS